LPDQRRKGRAHDRRQGGVVSGDQSRQIARVLGSLRRYDADLS